jgi:hypothetical protein
VTVHTGENERRDGCDVWKVRAPGYIDKAEQSSRREQACVIEGLI